MGRSVIFRISLETGNNIFNGLILLDFKLITINNSSYDIINDNRTINSVSFSVFTTSNISISFCDINKNWYEDQLHFQEFNLVRYHYIEIENWSIITSITCLGRWRNGNGISSMEPRNDI